MHASKEAGSIEREVIEDTVIAFLRPFSVLEIMHTGYAKFLRASLLACINKSASIHKTLKVGNLVNVNLLSSSQQEISTICSSSDLDVSRFDNDFWSYNDNQMPFLEDSQAIIGCKIEEILGNVDHSILILSFLILNFNFEFEIQN
jgi:hypothetical protein